MLRRGRGAIAGASVAAAFGCLLAGCWVHWRVAVARVASTDHRCPEANIHAISDNGDEFARVVELDVCGARRVYHDILSAREK